MIGPERAQEAEVDDREHDGEALSFHDGGYCSDGATGRRRGDSIGDVVGRGFDAVWACGEDLEVFAVGGFGGVVDVGAVPSVDGEVVEIGTAPAGCAGRAK